jgi:predicted DNA-binding transcriptional regulator YafY
VLQAIADMRGERWSVEVLLQTTLEAARGQVSAIGTTLHETTEGVVLRSSTSNLDWVARMLAGSSFPFVVRSPDELREELRRRAAELSALADLR